ncbi:hypothetical protein KDN24_05790 [Bacillus sp. Bva_UNVM-123]|uniref:hypothetical protein n=1 Tax=Bacillus sp. Bva_UNVM-123 TaxID=2829798 RepID=UPI00391F5A1F
MKKLFITASSLCILLFGSIFLPTTVPTYAEEKTNEEEFKEHHHHFINEVDFNRLLKQGYSKGDIYKAAHIAKFANQKIDDVLKTYKESDSSWKKTAEHYGLNTEELKKKCHEELEKFLMKNKETVVENVAEYTGKTEAEIVGYVEEGIPLRFLIHAAVIAKAGNKDLAELIKLKKEGKSYKDLLKDLNLDHKKLHMEKKTLIKKIKEDIMD